MQDGNDDLAKLCGWIFRRGEKERNERKSCSQIRTPASLRSVASRLSFALEWKCIGIPIRRDTRTPESSRWIWPSSLFVTIINRRSREAKRSLNAERWASRKRKVGDERTSRSSKTARNGIRWNESPEINWRKCYQRCPRSGLSAREIPVGITATE